MPFVNECLVTLGQSSFTAASLRGRYPPTTAAHPHFHISQATALPSMLLEMEIVRWRALPYPKGSELRHLGWPVFRHLRIESNFCCEIEQKFSSILNVCPKLLWFFWCFKMHQNFERTKKGGEETNHLLGMGRVLGRYLKEWLSSNHHIFAQALIPSFFKKLLCGCLTRRSHVPCGSSLWHPSPSSSLWLWDRIPSSLRT